MPDEVDHVSYRAARAADARAVTEYHQACWVQAFAALLEPGVVDELDPWRMLPVFDLWFDEEQTAVSTTIAEVGGAPVGHATVGGNEVVHLFVHPAHWGKGIGRRLLAGAEQRIASAGFDDAVLHTIVGNEPALALYRGAGWTVTDETTSFDGWGFAYDEHVLRKDLSTR